MRKKPDLRLTLVDQHGSRAVVEGREIDRVAEYWGLERILESFYDDLPIDKCPACGTTISQALDSGLMGCAACYEFVFPEYLSKMSQINESSPNSGYSPGPNQVS